MQRVILVGFAGSGKNTVGEYLVDKYGYVGVSFADALKDSVAAIFCWDRQLLEGNTPESRVWREQVDTWWAEKLGIPDFTPRWMLRNFGTEIMRRHFNTNIWISNVERRILDLGDKPVVVFDGRFQNEIAMMDRMGGQSIRVRRGPEPEWFDLALAANSDTFLHAPECFAALAEMGIHESEFGWIGTPIRHVLDNDGSVEELYRRTDELFGSG